MLLPPADRAFRCGGCSAGPEAYPVEFPFAPRQDPIILRFPTEVPAKPEENGDLDEGIWRINDRGGKVRGEPLETELCPPCCSR